MFGSVSEDCFPQMWWWKNTAGLVQMSEILAVESISLIVSTRVSSMAPKVTNWVVAAAW